MKECLIAKFESCEAHIVRSKKTVSIIFIMSAVENKGHAQTMLQNVITFARFVNAKEVWYPTPLNGKMFYLAGKLGFKWKCLGYDKRVKEKVYGYVYKIDA